jgi:hypothetical protein
LSINLPVSGAQSWWAGRLLASQHRHRQVVGAARRDQPDLHSPTPAQNPLPANVLAVCSITSGDGSKLAGPETRRIVEHWAMLYTGCSAHWTAGALILF